MAGTKSETKAKATNGQAPAKTLSKRDAVQDALQKLGQAAMPAALRDYVRDEHKLDVSLNHVSNIKSELKNKNTAPKKAPVMASAAQETKAPAKENTASKVSGSVSLDDVETVKQLCQRVGVEELHRLVDLLTK